MTDLALPPVRRAAMGLKQPLDCLLQDRRDCSLFRTSNSTLVRHGVDCTNISSPAIGTTALLFAHSILFILIGFHLFGIARAFSSGAMDAWFADGFN